MHNLPRCAAPVASDLVRNEIQHTSCFSPCELLNGSSSFRHYTFNSCTGTLPFHANGQTSYLPVGLQHSLVWLCLVWAPTQLRLSVCPDAILSDYTPNLLPTAFLRTGLVTDMRFGIPTKPDPGLLRQTFL